MLTPDKSSLNINQIHEVLGRVAQQYSLHYASRIDSTMNLLPWCKERGIDLVSGVCVIAGTQTNGVGQHGGWISGEADVKLSLVLDEVENPAAHAFINCIAAFAVQRTLTELVRDYGAVLDQPRFEVKLANDVLVRHQDKYRKISGSLAVGKHDPEMRALLITRDGFQFPEDKIVLGIGINLQQGRRQVIDPRFEPIALEDLTGNLISRELAIGVLLKNIRALSVIGNSNPGMLLNALRDVVVGRGNETVEVVTKQGDSLHGRVLEIRQSGLKLDGSRSIPLEHIQRVVPLN